MTALLELEDVEARYGPVHVLHGISLAVAEGSVDRLVGVVQARDIVIASIEGRPLELRTLVRQAPIAGMSGSLLRCGRSMPAPRTASSTVALAGATAGRPSTVSSIQNSSSA